MASVTLEELVREYFPDSTDDEVKYILWNKTAFPFGRPEKIREHLATYWAACQIDADTCYGCGGISFDIEDGLFCPPCDKRLREAAA